MLISSMGGHQLDVRYGDRNTLPWFNGILLSTLLSDDAIVASIAAGRVMSLTTGGFLVPGVLASTGSTGGEMPYFAYSGLDINNYPDSDRANGMPGYYTRPTDGIGTPGSPGFWGIPASAGLVGPFATIQWKMAGELSTTEYDQTTGATYVVGAPLTAVSAAATGTGSSTGHNGKSVRGILRPVENSTDVIVGYVAAAGVFTGALGYSMLAFVPAYVLGSTVPDTEVEDDGT